MFNIIKHCTRRGARAITGIGVTVAAIGIVLATSVGSANAWEYDTSVYAECVDGNVFVSVQYTNQERDRLIDLRIIVEKHDEMIYSIRPGETVFRSYDLFTNDTEGGKVYVEQTWSNGHGGMERNWIKWESKTCASTTTSTTAPTTSSTVPATTSTTVPPEPPVKICPDEGVCAPSIEVPEEPVSPTTPASSPEELAFTGSSTIWITLGGISLLIMGFTLILFPRKRMS